MLTHANLSKQVQQLEAVVPQINKGTEIMLGALPYFHVFGLFRLHEPVHPLGWTQVLVPRPQPEPLLESIRNFRPTFAPLCPPCISACSNHPDLEEDGHELHQGGLFRKARPAVEVIHEFEKATGRRHRGMGSV